MGLLARLFEACSHVLLADRRHGDVTSSLSQLFLHEEASSHWVRINHFSLILKYIWPELLYCFKHCVILLINGGIVQFSTLQTSAHKWNREFVSLFFLLRQHSCKQIVRGKSVQYEIFIEIRNSKWRCMCYCCFDISKCIIFYINPFKLYILLKYESFLCTRKFP